MKSAVGGFSFMIMDIILVLLLVVGGLLHYLMLRKKPDSDL